LSNPCAYFATRNQESIAKYKQLWHEQHLWCEHAHRRTVTGLQERMNRRCNPRESRKTYAYNTHHRNRPRNSSTQYGGTPIISQKNAAVWHHKSNKDPRGLGRWVDQTFKAKGTHFLTVICGYQPNQSKTAQPGHTQSSGNTVTDSTNFEWKAVKKP
jgi:hypothetical protein